jgi:lipopolysaccharide export system permease protein
MSTPVQQKNQTPDDGDGTERNGGPSPRRRLSPPPNAQRPTPNAAPLGVWDGLWFFPRLAIRVLFLFPRLVDRYVIGELLGPLAFGWTMFILIFVCSFNLFRLAKLLAVGARIGPVAEMLGLHVVISSVLCIPMAMLLAGLLGFGRLSGDSELIATQAAGIPNIRLLLRNALWLGLLLSVLGVSINEFAVPKAAERLHFLEAQTKAEIAGGVADSLAATGNRSFVIQDTEKGKLARLVVAKKFEPEDRPKPAMMHDVTYIQYDTKGEWETIVQSKSAAWKEKYKWNFYDANIQFNHTVTKDKPLAVHSDEAVFEIHKSVKEIVSEAKDEDEMSYREQAALIKELRKQGVGGRQVRSLQVSLERKLAIPFTALIFALVGAPLGIRRQRSTAGVGIGLSLLIVVVYYAGMSLLGVLGESGQVSPLEAAWGCNAVGLVAGLFLTWRASR